MLIYNQGQRLISSIKLYQKYRNGSGIFARTLCAAGKLKHMFWTIVSSSDIHRDAEIHETVRFPHLVGVVIHPAAVVEANCLIMQCVTLGQTADNRAPTVRSGAYIGAGAKILGNITIGKNARIGANAVVLKDVPDFATAVGVPARIIVAD